ncbi:hypothetical protein Tco_0347365 [Tanacetum coccineum]
MSPGGSTMASCEDVNSFLACNTPPDHLIRTYFEQIGVVPKVVFNILEKLVLLLGRHPFNNEIPRVVICIIGKPRAQVDQGSQIKMIQVKEMMQDNDLKNSKSKDKGSKSRSQSMDEQSHYKQDKTITRQSINVKRHIFNVIGGTEEFEERDLNIGGDC